MQRDRFNSGRYCNWVKGSLSLCYLKEGVTEFSNDKAAAFHRAIVQRVSLRQPNVASSQCVSCTHKQAVKTKSKDKKTTTWRMNCRMNICSVWLEEILPYHRHQPCPDIAWKNSDPRLWPSDCWEVVKIFQPYGCQHQRRAEDCDAVGLLTMIQDCRFFSKFITNPAIIQDIKTARNACMHSNDLEMSDAEMQQSLNLMVAFLEEPELQKHQTARDAVVKIKQLRDNILDLSLNKELELKALLSKMTEMEQNVTSVKDVTQNLRDDINIRMDSLRKDISDLRLTSQVHQADITTLYQRQQDTDGELQRARLVSKVQVSRLRHQQRDIDTHTDKLGKHELRLQSNQGDIETHKTTLGRHELRLQSHQGDIDTHTDKLGGHELRLQSHRGDIDTHKATLGGHGLRLQSHQGDIDTHRAMLEGHELRLQSHQGDIDTHKATLGGHELRLQSHQGDIDTHKATLGEHGLRLQSHQGDIDTHRAKLGGHDLRLQSHQGDIDTQRVTLGGHELRLQSHQGDIDTQRAKLGGHELRLQSHQGDIDTHKATLGGHEHRLQSHQGDIDTQRAKLGGHELRLQSHQGDIDTHKAELGDHELKLQSHQGDIDTQKARLGGHELRLEAQHRKLESHEAKLDTLGRQQQELQQQNPGRGFNVEDIRATLLGVYKERLHSIPVYIIKPDWKHPVEDLFVKQKLERVDPRGKPEHPDNPHMQMAGNQDQIKHKKDDKNRIDKVTDIFFKDGIICKDVYITSEAGYGKTSLCAHLVRLWCDAHSKSDADLASTDPDLSKDLQSMKRFNLLFYINLREADISNNNPKSDEISLLVYTQLELSDQAYSIADIKRCLSDPSTLVLMDSLDEMRSTRLPYRGLHNKSCIVTTSRPWKLEALRSQLHSKIGYQQIEIVGLTETSPYDLVKNVLKILNKEYEQKKKGGEFLSDIHNSDLNDFLTIPVLILQMLSLWFDGESFGRSQSEIYSNVIHHQILTTLKTKELPRYEGISQEQFPFSCCSGLNCHCEAYGDLLWKVSRLAFHTLFGENREMCLVFDHKITSFYGLSDEEVEICLKMGMLTQHKLFVKKISEDKKSVSFLHKTNQEYFAAVYLSDRWTDSVKKKIFSVINDLDRAMELDKVLLFCSQLNPEVARELSGLISVQTDDDRRVQEYRQSGEYAGEYDSRAPNKDLIYKIQNIVSAAVQQNITISSLQPITQDSSAQQSPEVSTPSTQDRSRSTPKLILADIGEIADVRHSRSRSNRQGLIGKMKKIITQSSQENRSKSTSTQESPSQQPAVAFTPSKQDRSRSTPKLILADIIAEEPQWRRTEKDRPVNVGALDMAAVKSVRIDALYADVTIWKHLERARCLQTFVVKNVQETKVETLHGVVLRNQASLRTLGLHGGYSRLDLSPLGNKLADMLTRDLDLTCLLLYRVELSKKQCEMLCRHLSTTQNLRRLTLNRIECQTHGGGGWEYSRVEAGCCDVKLHSKLELLKLEWLPFNHVSFPADDLKTCEIWLYDNVPAATSAISCLTSASNLREFTCRELWDVASVRELVTVLPRLHGLQRIVLSYIDFGCLREIRLSAAAAKTLESVELERSTITADGLESLVQSVDASRVKITLRDVTITDGDPREFLQQLRDSPDVEVTENSGVENEDARWGRVCRWKVWKFVFYKKKQQTS